MSVYSTFSERLDEAVRWKGPLCVGLDPQWRHMPKSIREAHPNLPAEPRCQRALVAFCERILDLVDPYTRVVKIQSAFFELYGSAGMEAMHSVLGRAQVMGFVTILDQKRGDIANTATAYADAAFTGFELDGERHRVLGANAITVNPYLGEDAVEPFITAAKAARRGLFVLVRTSNPGAGLFQDLVCDGRPLYRHVAEAVGRWNAPSVNENGFGDIGAVVGAMHPDKLRELREVLPNAWFLVPGYGSQGGTAADVKAAYMGEGIGTIVNSSRGVIYSYLPDDPDWESKVAAAAANAAKELRP